jgi:hypothetical protein
VRIRVFAGIGIAVALLGLTGCRSSPTVAAYVGDQTLTEAEVTTLIDKHVEWVQEAADQRAKDEGLEHAEKVQPPDRTLVVNTLVRGMLCQQAQDRLKFPVENPQLPAEPSELFVRVNQGQACEKGLPGGEPVKPTEQQARQIFDLGVANGIWQPDQASQQIPGLMENPDLADALGRKKALNDAIGGTQVTVNPKYGVLEMPLISFTGGVPAVSLIFGQPAPVNNRPIQPSPTPTPAPPQ